VKARAGVSKEIVVTLTARLNNSRRFTRLRQSRAEARMDEQLLVAEAREQVDDFIAHDSVSDTTFEAAIRRLYATLDSEEQKQLAASVYAVWKAAEIQDDVILGDHAQHIDRTRVLMFQNTPMFVDGAYAPDGSDGAA
jgi:hypothetical protein